MKLKVFSRLPRQGSVLILTLVFFALFTVVAIAVVNLAILHYRLSRQQVAKEHALQIAEAGLNYYLWHLAHDPEDLTDGTGKAGP